MDQLLLRKLKEVIDDQRAYIVDSLAAPPSEFHAEYRHQKGVLKGLIMAYEMTRDMYQRKISDEAD